ncbi:MAG: outer membrane protein assembly factor BamD, partial [Proteobacteria bacterium]|nr:outer membrane protein assembly factor BamD [Pseudomonadota bacterium]
MNLFTSPPAVWRRNVLAVLLVTGLAACSTTKDEYVERPVEDLYNAGVNALLDSRYSDAAKQFDEVERQHPYSVWATK